MTEAEWVAATNPTLMLNFLHYQTSDRKMRLFAVACCRLIMNIMTDEGSRKAVEVAARYIEGQVAQEELLAAERLLSVPRHCETPVDFSIASAAYLVTGTAFYSANKCAVTTARAFGLANGDSELILVDDDCEAGEAERACEVDQSTLVRDIFGNPFCQVDIKPDWLTPKVVSLAKSIYDEWAFEQMPELASALVEGGCDNDQILRHCRGDEPHIRGCWVVDLLLGKE